MLIEVKTKVSRVIDGKTRKITETYLTVKELFAEAEYQITQLLAEEQQSGVVEDFEIQSLRISPIKEVATQYTGECGFILTLKYTFTEDDGTVKYLRYKVLIRADSLTQANQKAQELSRQGYDMLLEGIKQVDYQYLGE